MFVWVARLFLLASLPKQDRHAFDLPFPLLRLALHHALACTMAMSTQAHPSTPSFLFHDKGTLRSRIIALVAISSGLETSQKPSPSHTPSHIIPQTHRLQVSMHARQR